TAHVESHTTSACARIHPPDCALCRFLTAPLTPLRPATLRFDGVGDRAPQHAEPRGLVDARPQPHPQPRAPPPLSYRRPARRASRSDNAAKSSITQIPPGRYTISIRVIGYAPQVRKVTVGNADVTVDVTLKPSVIELPAVQVSASAEATSALNSPQPIATVSEEDLTKVRPTSLGEALADIAGVRNNSSGAAAGKPVIRGLTNNRVLVLDNG